VSDDGAAGGAPARLTRAEIEAAYQTHAHSVIRRAERILGSPPEAREVLQEVFMGLLERPEQFERRSSLLTWLYRATTHRCLKRLRDGATRRRLTAENAALLAKLGQTCSPEHALELRRALNDLPEPLQELAIYRYLDALSYDELAEVTGYSRRKVAYLLAELATVTEKRGET
jgi:RNA polymerase sigma-70 factor (ECF subfamily)